jgi:ABC-type multidrug transport system ATPase subunit
MSDNILKALMQLFAIVANREKLTDKERGVVEAFLLQQVSQSHYDQYLSFFDEYLQFLQGRATTGKATKRVSVNSVKVLKICTDINSELDQKQKYVVLVKLIEFAWSFDEPPGEQELEFIHTVGSVFNISDPDVRLCIRFASAAGEAEIPDSPQILFINYSGTTTGTQAHTIPNETLHGNLCFLHITQESIIFTRYFGPMQLLLNGQVMIPGRSYAFSQGSVIREARLQPVYYSDVIRCYLDYSATDDIYMEVNMVEYYFPNGRKGMHPITFSASSGSLVGIMGGSGAGKSTLLNILNGNLVPRHGEVLINGLNIHTQRKDLLGMIGYIPQDDLLMEDLTVYQNLFYNSKLALGELDDAEIDVQVRELLESLGLWEIRHLRVGDVLNKTVSGGQRKRLNIALELIRKPAVLFVDEPTSGLSSLDSENVMDLLKQLSLSGKLVFVVIHQPSSDIFKLFDKLLILDVGGYPIYYGNPSDSVIYFKKKANLADADTSECETCGNINPEQIFSIIESKVFNEFGQATQERKIKPAEWYRFYEDNRLPNAASGNRENKGSESFSRPGMLRQASVFITRDVLSKLKNSQYLLINFLEAPVLAFILAWFLKYYKPEAEYLFRDNLNLPAYIFMCVIVALFMGLTVSAEEIIRDRKILKREEFLNLSRGGYLMSKTAVLLLISAIQTLSFVLIGNTIFEIQGMYTDYWLMLFSISVFGNLLGLNISASFNSAVTIYILIPFLIIPQIILSGVMVKFENLNPHVTSQTRVPVIGEIMASRWAFEALAVNQYKNNEYQKHFFETEKELAEIVYRKDFWLVRMNDKLDSLNKGLGSKNMLQLMNHEISVAGRLRSGTGNPVPAELTLPLKPGAYKQSKDLLAALRKQYIDAYKITRAQKDQVVKRMEKQNPVDGYLNRLKTVHTNESLDDLLLVTNDFEFIVEDDGRLVRRFRPVLMDGPEHGFVRSQFFVSGKYAFGKPFSTWSVNLAVIWTMTAILMFTLYFNALRQLLRWMERLPARLKKNR